MGSQVSTSIDFIREDIEETQKFLNRKCMGKEENYFLSKMISDVNYLLGLTDILLENANDK